MPRRIAYVEDENATRESYARRLREEGFEVTDFASKTQALARLRGDPHDLALLDVTHAEDREAGYEICEQLRKLYPELPIVFLTHRNSEIDKISGLRLGADDYISKEASMEYLVVRIETLFRRLDTLRSKTGDQPPSIERTSSENTITLDDTHLLVQWRGKRVDLPLTQYWIVKALCTQPGQVKTHRELMRACNLVVEPNTITAHVKAIRASFLRLDPQFNCIKTERGRGYRWVPPA
jgi:two-component system OmpR family response regulator